MFQIQVKSIAYQMSLNTVTQQNVASSILKRAEVKNVSTIFVVDTESETWNMPEVIPHQTKATENLKIY